MDTVYRLQQILGNKENLIYQHFSISLITKSYDNLSREELWHILREKDKPTQLLKAITPFKSLKDMYKI
jgi:hypothetical protein